jgi:hypothetical protein
MLDLFDKPLAVISDFDNANRRLIEPLLGVRGLLGNVLEPSQVNRNKVRAVARFCAVFNPFLSEQITSRIREACHVLLLESKATQSLLGRLDLFRVN